MEKVNDIGGLFFRAQNPEKLALWYKKQLGVPTTPTDYAELPWMQEAGPTVIAPFPEKSDYFGNIDQKWMVNFRVRGLNAMAAQLQAAGIAVQIDSTIYPNGRFARLNDPEGNPIELWQPAENNVQS